MKYKIGDKVTLTNGNIMTIDQIDDISKWYRMKEDPWNCYTDEMIEGLVEEENIIDIDEFQDDNEIIDIIDEYVHRLKDNECQINLPEGYQFTDENGNVINATKIVLEKKEKEYPKTFLGCCDVLGIEDTISRGVKGYKSNLLDTFQKLLICRDAYWKIAGDEMGLGKPWEPDWNVYEHKFCLGTDKDKVIEECVTTGNRILAFPTAEMRDAFYENFKELIEQCKELL